MHKILESNLTPRSQVCDIASRKELYVPVSVASSLRECQSTIASFANGVALEAGPEWI